MQEIVVKSFGGPETLEVVEKPTPEPGPMQVRVRVTSVGLNHADLMGRAGRYKLSTGEPPYVPGLEAGGVIEEVGDEVDPARIGERVSLAPSVPRAADGPHGGTYRSHLLADESLALIAPDALPDEQLGAVWLAYLTAWGCLAWKDKLEPGAFVAIPAASSSVGLAAAQVVKALGGTAIGLTSSPPKADALKQLDTAVFDHLVVTHDRDDAGNRTMRPWHREIKQLTGGKGVDVFFDPVAAGEYLSTEARALAHGGRIYIYGLLGQPGAVDLSPMIVRNASLHGWVLDEIVKAGESVWQQACRDIFQHFIDGTFKQHVGKTYAFKDVQHAHAEMQKGEHIGKLVLVPEQD
ncbi:MAG: zinc-dependent alcohol dehydrogenase family protein [Phycisphaeraceae bacterium]